MTSFPALVNPFGMSRILRVSVRQRMREDNVLERIWLNRHIQHAFEFSWPALSSTDRGLLEAFFAACRGRYLGDIVYVDPWDSVSYTCRLDNDELMLAEVAPSVDWWTGGIRLVEVSSFKANKEAVATFPATVPCQGYSRGLRYQTVIGATMGDGEKRFEDLADATGIQRWTVGGNALTDAQAGDLLDCWEGNGGPWAGFTFTEPVSSTPYDAHFAESQIVHTLVTRRTNGEFVSSLFTTLEELKS